MEAVAGPTMPANVAVANNILGTQPYANLIISYGQALGGGIVTSQEIQSGVQNAVQQYDALSPAMQQTQLQQLYALWNFLPSYLSNAPIVDAWFQQNGLPTANNTAMGQAAQQYLQQLFAAFGVTPPSSGSSSGSGSSSSGDGQLFFIGLAAALVLILVVAR